MCFSSQLLHGHCFTAVQPGSSAAHYHAGNPRTKRVPVLTPCRAHGAEGGGVKGGRRCAGCGAEGVFQIPDRTPGIPSLALGLPWAGLTSVLQEVATAGKKWVVCGDCRAAKRKSTRRPGGGAVEEK